MLKIENYTKAKVILIRTLSSKYISIPVEGLFIDSQEEFLSLLGDDLYNYIKNGLIGISGLSRNFY